MTLIECFDDSALENIAAALLLPVSRLVLLGDKRRMGAAAFRYEAFLKNRGRIISIELHDTAGKGLKDLTALLRGIVSDGDRYVIDLNGGDEMTVLAVGSMLAGLDEKRRRNVSVQKFDLENGTVFDCDSDGITVKGRPASLSVRELIALHGGIVHPHSYQPEESCKLSELDPLWELVAEDPRKWNRTLMALSQFESYSDSKEQVFLVLSHLRSVIKGFDEKEELIRDLLQRLDRKGLVEDHSTGNCLDYTYRSNLIRYCTKKAGNVLEVKTLLEARALKENGMPRFSDCQMGVSIDWDGIPHEVHEHVPDTKNEIDLILTQGLRSLFISCKNGDIGDEELYKLHTVATRFGGPNVRKMLIATNLDRKSDAANDAFAVRAKDMGIYLVADAAALSPAGWKHIFRDAMK